MTEVSKDLFGVDVRTCPKCSNAMNHRHWHGEWLAPECWWWECEDCGFKTEPE